MIFTVDTHQLNPKDIKFVHSPWFVSTTGSVKELALLCSPFFGEVDAIVIIVTVVEAIM